MRWAGIHAVQYDAVEVRIRVQGGAESLDRAHSPALGALHAVADAGATTLVGEE
jgi:hypothetical protein